MRSLSIPREVPSVLLDEDPNASTRRRAWRDVVVELRSDDPAEWDGHRAAADQLTVVVQRTGSSLVECAGPSGGTVAAHHSPGSIWIAAPGDTGTARWQRTAPGTTTSLHVGIGPAIVLQAALRTGFATSYEALSRSHLRDEAVLGFAAALESSIDTDPTGAHVRALAGVLAAHLMIQPSAQPVSSPSGGLDAATLARVLQHVRSRLQEPLTVDDLAAVAFLSRAHFLRAFHRSTGYTPHQFVMELRLCRAAELLTETDLLVESIAATCGWRSRSQFIAAFRARHGTSPSRYRAAA